MLSMTEIKIKEEVKAMERELLEVGKMIVEEEAIRREKIAGCNAAREMHEAQVSASAVLSIIEYIERMLTYHIQLLECPISGWIRQKLSAHGLSAKEMKARLLVICYFCLRCWIWIFMKMVSITVDTEKRCF